MTENREKEWLNLLMRATQMLENPHLLPKDVATKQFIPTLHLWISPTFTPDKHWIFYTPQHQLNPQPKPIVRQIIWRKEMDYPRVMNPETDFQDSFQLEPTFETKTVEIELETYRKIHDDLAKIKLPPFIKDEVLGLDGEQFGVETLGFYHNAKITWWSSYPEEWKELVDWYEKVGEFLEEKLNDH